ncbi:MAG: hypothetical protein OXC31_16535, partial [Spirochaetaceae bacterium]|nr:hypothetical protein [Spirochaetaceae bacterium]
MSGLTVRVIGRKEEEHGTLYPSSPDIDLGDVKLTQEAAVLILDRWLKRLGVSAGVLAHIVNGQVGDWIAKTK